jgi:ABC-type amino acid transport system permease subunit
MDKGASLKSACMYFFAFRNIPLLIVLLIITAALPAHANYYDGDDWEGMDLILVDGDTLSGDFVNVGMFSIPVGATISGIGGNISVNARSILVDGALDGDP